MSSGIATWIRLAVLSVIAVVVSVFLGWQAGQTPVPPGVPLAPTPWTLSSRPAEDPARDLGILTARLPWTNAFLAASSAGAGAKAPGTAGAASDPKSVAWRLAGIGRRPDEDFVVIAIGQPDATKFEYRHVGDALPDGSTLVQITSDNAVTAADGPSGEQRVYWLFRGKP